MIKSIIVVFIGGGLGSVLRFLFSYLFSKLNFISNLPLATILVNLLSCLFMGIIILNLNNNKLLANQKWIYLLITVGFLGGFSTFSTFSFETYSLIKNKHYLLAVANIAISLISTLAIFFLVLQRQGTKD